MHPQWRRLVQQPDGHWQAAHQVTTPPRSAARLPAQPPTSTLQAAHATTLVGHPRAYPAPPPRSPSCVPSTARAPWQPAAARRRVCRGGPCSHAGVATVGSCPAGGGARGAPRAGGRGVSAARPAGKQGRGRDVGERAEPPGSERSLWSGGAVRHCSCRLSLCCDSLWGILAAGRPSPLKPRPASSLCLLPPPPPRSSTATPFPLTSQPSAALRTSGTAVSEGRGGRVASWAGCTPVRQHQAV